MVIYKNESNNTYKKEMTMTKDELRELEKMGSQWTKPI